MSTSAVAWLTDHGAEIYRMAEHASAAALREGVSQTEIARLYDKLMETRTYPEAWELVVTWFDSTVPESLPN